MSNFTDLLVDCSGIVKTAAIDLESEEALEYDFSQLAFAFFRDRAAPLMEYLLGFEIVESAEDGSKAIGIFGCKIGDKYYYVPAFFVNKQIKGMDLLYSKADNLFIPLDENWINDILNKQVFQLGSSVSDPSKLQTDFESPNFDFLKEPYGKSAGYLVRGVRDGSGPYKDSFMAAVGPGPGRRMLAGEECPIAAKLEEDNDSDMEEYIDEDGNKKLRKKKNKKKEELKKESASSIVDDAFNVWNLMQTKMAEMLDNDLEMQKAWASVHLKLVGDDTILEKTADGSKLIEYIANHGGPEATAALMSTLSSNYKFASAALSFYPSVESLYVHQFNMEPKTAESKIKVITTESETKDLSDDDKKQIVASGFVIKDLRDSGSKSETFDVDYTKQFTSPDEPGLYDILLSNGGTTEAWAIGPAKPSNNMLVIQPDNMYAVSAAARDVIAKGAKKDNKKSIFAKAVKAGEVEPGCKYIAINDKLDTTDMFTVRRVRASNNTRTEFDISLSMPYPQHKERGTWNELTYDYLINSIETIQIADFESGVIRTAGSKLIVPSNWKFLKLKTECYLDSDEDKANYSAFKLGNLIDLDEALFKNGVHKLVVETDTGSEYSLGFNSFSEGPYNYKTAAVRLVRDYGMDVDDALSTLDDATRNLKARRLVKIAQVGVSMPTPNEQLYGMDPYTGMPMQGPDEQNLAGQFTGVPQLQDSSQIGFNLGGESSSNIQTMQDDIAQLAQQAEVSGQKSIFDHATIAGLSQLHDVSSIIDTYIPEMTKALDRIGRLLFLFYWKNTDFVDRYGDIGLSDMEDLIRNVFKSFGELVLTLKQKAISENVDDTI